MKKLLCLMLVCCMLLGLVACSSPSTETGTAVDSNSNEETSNSSIKAPEPVKASNATINFKPSKDYSIDPVTPVKAAEATIDFEVGDFDIIIADNVSDKDTAKISGLTEAEKQAILIKKKGMLTALLSAFKKNGIDVMINTTSGEIILDAAILFATDEAKVSDSGKSFLQKFTKAYASVLCNNEYADFISQIIIEGHTDTNGSYDYNKKLSTNRAENVKKICLSGEASLADDIQKVLKKKLKAEGCSYDRPITDASGNVDMDASRRVSFRFLINID